MIKLIVTADDDLYDRLAAKANADGHHLRRAIDVLDGLQQARAPAVGTIIVDMSLHAADTLVETLHNRPRTSHIPLFVVETCERLPFELRRLCTDVLEADAL
jgi:hypothetical protein